ncbi:major facilitator superfamily domain-containing protein [Aspergillus unguis]
MSPPKRAAWRSSRRLIMATSCIALFTESLLSGFPVPMLPYMLEERLRGDPAQTTHNIDTLLSLHGFVTMMCSPVFAKFFDKNTNQKAQLFLSLGICLVGTGLVASTPTLWALYLGRVLQGVAGSAAWLVCTTMITQTASEGGLGRVLGTSMSFITIGVVSGPMLGGVLLGWSGYWAAWSVPMALLVVDMIMRLVMVQPKRHSASQDTSQDTQNEESPLLPPPSPSAAQPECNFYAVTLSNVSIWTGILNTIVQSGIRAGFNATLPVYLRDTFDWGPSKVGAMFFALQVPIIFLSPVLGWARDRVGVRSPTTVGWILLAPLLCFLGIPGSGISWTAGGNPSQQINEAAFIACICGIGLLMPFTQGAGALSIRQTVRKMEKEFPGVFGPNGGSSRCFALTSVSYNAGLGLGPAVIGWLTRSIGYLYMNIFLGAVCLGVAAISFLFY